MDALDRTRTAVKVVDELRRGVGLPRDLRPFDEVILGDEAFAGVDAETVFPDVVILPRADWILRADHSDPRLIRRRNGWGEHHRLGVVLAHGPHVQGGSHGAPDMRDVLPTILALHGFAPPDEASGCAIDWIAPAADQALPPVESRVAAGEERLDPVAEKKIEAHLQGLGYLD